MFRQSSWLETWVCALVPVVLLVLVRPVAASGISDDFSYIWTAKQAAETGHLVYAGWAAASVGWTAYYGAAFFKLFGFSFTIAHCSMIVVGMVCSILLHRLLLQLGVSRGLACLASISLTLSPVFFPFAVSFFTDVPGALSTFICAYCCVQAFLSISRRAAMSWLLAAIGSNLLIGSARQVSWLGALVMVPTFAWNLRTRYAIGKFAVTCWIVSVGLVVLAQKWLHAQPYFLNSPPFESYHRNQIFKAVILLTSGLILFAPLFSLLLFKPAKSQRRRWGLVVGCISCLTIVASALLRPLLLVDILWDMSQCTTNIPTGIGIVLIGFSTLSLMVGVLVKYEPELNCQVLPLSSAKFLKLMLPFTVAYSFLAVTRDAVFARYWLGVMPLVITYVLLLRTERNHAPDHARVPLFSVAMVFVFATLAVCFTHDSYALRRGNVDALKAYLTSGKSRWDLEAGFELDGWDTMQANSYVNNLEVQLPKGRLRIPLQTADWRCHDFALRYMPLDHPVYVFSYGFNPCATGPPLYVHEVATWLPPRARTAYIWPTPALQNSIDLPAVLR